MRPEALKQLVDFVALGVILGLSLFGLYFFRFQIDRQLIITVILGFSYVFWGIFHHLHTGTLKLPVVLEYISISALVVFILALFLLRV
ncbi:hypothetical protein A2872_02730 [Candidatus Gottesmanbacteria bacterium RIFCSPHIGHO2_01_FULL_42_12]|uniref:Uncharacterized protein n=1 Tax=Candidatus Gottesmanbacteria bacterium RIFCSPHIGHO2_01_FULL_42_12 TaxID=1798377 RepID=A0A1F5Z3Q7_9BACT|nr:MAG: hypothetical protein A2872_02730 [Candidatus Gottesmanbacteria bacterium RIFCSPHIGHO2_01_FULL_42_12]